MDRIAWLQEKRQEVEERYSELWAPLYWKEYGLYPNAAHQQYLNEFIHLLPKGSRVLDAACGAGRYMPMLLEAGFTVLGIDQAEGMLARAREKFPEIQLEKVGLQELSYQEEFDGAICMDAMEHICPEDWLPVLTNIQRALKNNHYYPALEQVREWIRQAGLELQHEGGGDGYHHFIVRKA